MIIINIIVIHLTPLCLGDTQELYYLWLSRIPQYDRTRHDVKSRMNKFLPLDVILGRTNME